jgi:diguanylate cyclase (GGDEF)-like protein
MRLVTFVVMTLLLSKIRQDRMRDLELSSTDPLTGALNSRAFLRDSRSVLDHAERLGRPTSLAFFDVDDFKIVNDQIGHAAGDELLRIIVSVMRARVRASDLVVRMGGDEFAVLLPDTDVTAAHDVVGRLCQALVETTRRGGWIVGFSVGLVTYREATSIEEMLKDADNLMYVSKRRGKNCVVHEVRGVRQSVSG